MDPISRMMMAGSVGGGGEVSVEYVADTSFNKTTSDTGTNTVTLSGLQADDVVFLFYVGKDKTASTFVTNTADMSGWTAVLDDNNLQYANEEPPDSYGTPSRGVWYKVSTGSSVSIDLDDVPATDKTQYSVQLVAFRGLETTGPASPSRLIYQGNPFTSITVPARIGPAFATINVVGHWVGSGNTQTWTQTEATGYTDLGAIGMGTGAEYSSMTVSYLEVSASADLSARTFTNSPSADLVAFEFFLIAKGQDDSAPVITGSTSVVVTSPATSVTTYSADQSVTWSLSGTDASLFSISSGGALTFSSPSVDGVYQLTITATDPDNFTDDIDVTVASTTTGTSGGGISLRSATTAATSTSGSTTVSLSSLSAGDVVYLHLGSDSGSANTADTQASLTSNGWTLDTDSPYSSSVPALHVYWKARTTSGTETVTFSAASGASTRFGVVMSAWIGVDNTTPTSGYSRAITALSSSVTVPSWLVPGPGVILYIGGLDDDGSAVSSGPSGYTEVGVQTVAPTSGATVAVYYRNTAGNETTSPETITFATTDGCGAFAYQLRAD